MYVYLYVNFIFKYIGIGDGAVAATAATVDQIRLDKNGSYYNGKRSYFSSVEVIVFEHGCRGPSNTIRINV